MKPNAVQCRSLWGQWRSSWPIVCPGPRTASSKGCWNHSMDTGPWIMNRKSAPIVGTKPKVYSYTYIYIYMCVCVCIHAYAYIIFYNMTLYNYFGDRIMSKSVKSFRIVGLSFSSIFKKHIPPGCFLCVKASPSARMCTLFSSVGLFGSRTVHHKSFHNCASLFLHPYMIIA